MEPLFFRVYESHAGREAYLQNLVVCSLDVVEECVAARASSGGQDMYLGLLAPIDAFRLYGYATSTSARVWRGAPRGDPRPRRGQSADWSRHRRGLVAAPPRPRRG